MSSENIYYVYLYIDPTNEQPFYVGYGKNNRKSSHIKEARNYPLRQSYKLNKIRKLLKENNKPIIKIIDSNISKTQAIELEIFMISFIGRITMNEGPLTNLTSGGDGGDTSKSENFLKYVQSMKEICKNRRWWNNGISQKFCENKPSDDFILGRLHFENNGAIKGSAIQKNKIWINDGKTEKMISKDDIIPSNFEKGRIYRKEFAFNKQKGRKWWNNGLIEKMSIEQPDSTFKEGRIKSLGLTLD